MKKILLFFLLFTFSGCDIVEVETKGIIKNLRFSPSAFDPYRGNTKIRYSLSKSATVTIWIERDEKLVRNIATDIKETQGTHEHSWLGGDNTQHFVSVGTYIGVVVTGDERGEATVEVFHW
ncbi:MAG: hypothetical protein COT45_02020 [bacterium (Candidatus Stahlbacteria) CG08_land_8_20_14_0_20_40_26]|nr:MAG: hypothetical protein COT45_02020 [bacterium (Candidatus Stahlbacteria) CG08_land_8_20_14_0_20_40_26]